MVGVIYEIFLQIYPNKSREISFNHHFTRISRIGSILCAEHGIVVQSFEQYIVQRTVVTHLCPEQNYKTTKQI